MISPASRSLSNAKKRRKKKANKNGLNVQVILQFNVVEFIVEFNRDERKKAEKKSQEARQKKREENIKKRKERKSTGGKKV